VVELPLGRRIELARHRRGMSRQALGDLIGRSGEWIRQVERGDRAVDRLSLLLGLATVLKVVDLPGFLGCAAPRGTPADPVAGESPAAPVDALKDVVYRPDSPGHSSRVGDPDRQVMAAWVTWQDTSSPYAATLTHLPALLRRLSPDDDSTGVAHAYRLASAVLGRLGEKPGALIAAQRALGAARSGDCVLTEASCLATYADALVQLGAIGVAIDVCREAALLLAEHSDAATPATVAAATGIVHLSAARAAASTPAAQESLASAARAAQLALLAGTDREPDPRYPFGRLDVEVHAVRIALKLGHLRDAVRLAHRLDVAQAPARVRRSRSYITVACVHARDRNPPAVLYALSKAEHACAEELIYNRHARATISDLLSQENALIRNDLWALASRLGMA